jgi:hypothetical protein
MRGYREPGFQDRTAAAKEARQKALEQLREKPPIDEAEQAERLANRLAKEAAARERREAILREREAEKAAKREKAEQAAAALAKANPEPVVLTEAERKAARDARYAARKARK